LRAEAEPGGQGLARFQGPANTMGMVAKDMTVRAVIERLTDSAASLPGGLDSPVVLAICDGEDMVIIKTVDVAVLPVIRTQEPVGEVTRLPVMVRGHQHPGDEFGPVLHGLVADAEDLRKLTGEPGVDPAGLPG
jgi:hypothetical protein